MVVCGLACWRCRWLLPLLLGLAIIMGIIALAGRGWLESESEPYVQQASLWESCTRGPTDLNWNCESLMDYGWGRAAAATYLVGFVILVICFALAVIAFSIEILRFNFVRGIGGLLFVVAAFQIIGLVIYPVKFAEEIPLTGDNMFSWAYGFGWASTVVVIGCAFFFCCLPNWEDEVLGNIKPTYYYSSPERAPYLN
ncbi:p53 apoptosis effector related to PMP-22-like [Grus americana]|uniref:p53 apoptosis effector related to PMP-22 n=3 Tax=Gruiformes TaxID=9108 RepID=A0ABC9WMR5_GRUJA|nr:p53 apoptosis effector related to PMP-22-like [Grus americana]NWH22983.1 PERP protein [Grus americana]NXO51886.1 PERP protein [Aramus guarauna]